MNNFRSIILAAAAAAAGLSSCQTDKTVSDAAPEKEMALQLYSIREVIGDSALYADNHKEVFARLRDMGYTGVETANFVNGKFYGVTPEQFRTDCEEAGLEPVPDFILAEYVLEEDTDDVPLIEYDFGKEGKHFLVCGPEGREKKLIPELRRRLGADFDFAQPVSDVFDMFDDDECDYVERYSYEYPEYPSEAAVKHQFVADTLLSPEYADNLPDGFAGRVFALPPTRPRPTSVR